MRAMMISFFWGHGPGPVKISGDWCSFLDKKIERASGARQRRGWHQDGVSDIDAYKYPRPNAPAMASAGADLQLLWGILGCFKMSFS
jgi:hypothetical protein